MSFLGYLLGLCLSGPFKCFKSFCFGGLWCDRSKLAAEVTDHFFFLNGQMAFDHAAKQITPQLCKWSVLVYRINSAINRSDRLWPAVRLAWPVLFAYSEWL